MELHFRNSATEDDNVEGYDSNVMEHAHSSASYILFVHRCVIIWIKFGLYISYKLSTLTPQGVSKIWISLIMHYYTWLHGLLLSMVKSARASINLTCIIEIQDSSYMLEYEWQLPCIFHHIYRSNLKYVHVPCDLIASLP